MTSEVFDKLQQGIELQQQGQLQAAEKIYHQVLHDYPDHPDALHLLGVMAFQIGEFEAAEDLIRHAIESEHAIADYFNNLGEVLRVTGRPDEARECYQQALSLDPDHRNANENLAKLDQTTDVVTASTDAQANTQADTPARTPRQRNTTEDLIPPVRHAMPSYLLSLDDEPHQPNQNLIDLALLSAHHASKLDLETIKFRFAPEMAQFLNVWPGEHYRLLAAIVSVLQPKCVIEIGTATGASALTMKHFLPDDSRLITYDISPWQESPGCGLRETDFDEGFEQRIIDLSNPLQSKSEIPTLQQAELIFVDTTKDNQLEHRFCELFDSINFDNTPIVIFDDIRVMPMLKVWRNIHHPKLDLTSFGHWSGTGLVEWRNA